MEDWSKDGRSAQAAGAGSTSALGTASLNATSDVESVMDRGSAKSFAPVAQTFVPQASVPTFTAVPTDGFGEAVVTPVGPHAMGAPQLQLSISNPSHGMMAQTVSQGGGGSYVAMPELAVGALVSFGGEFYRVQQVVQPKDPAKGEPPKSTVRVSPTFSDFAPKEAASLFKDVWDGREARRNPRGLLAGCHEALLVLLTHLESRASSIERGGRSAPPRRGGFFGSGNSAKGQLKERIERLIHQGLLLRGVSTSAMGVKLEPPTEPEARIQVSEGDIDAYISLLWQIMEQGFDHARWSTDHKFPPHRTPPLAPTGGAQAKTELPVGAAVLIPTQSHGAKPA